MLDKVCQDPGFFYLTGHGVSEADIDHLHTQAKAFFALSREEKDKIAWSHCPEAGRGYQRLGENVTQGHRDWHEAIDFYAEVDERNVDLQALSQGSSGAEPCDIAGMRPLVFGRNRWPEKPEGFQAAAEAHFAAMTRIGQALMHAMADCFGTPPEYFDRLTDRSFWCARIIGYPPLQDAAPTTGDDCPVGLSCGEHTDYGCWTILAQDNTAGALEARMSDGSWVPVQPVPGAFVVNLGDMLSVWTRRRFSATPHRVRQTTRDKYRTSIPFFFEPNFDAVIDPLEGLGSEGAAAPLVGSTAPLERAMAGGSLVYGEHLYAKVSSNLKPL